MTSTPSTRCQLGGVALRSLAARSSQHGRVRAEQGLRAPDSLFDVRTGVEMEALTAVNLAALTIYDMCKAVDKKMRITNVKLVSKTKQ